jgi:hypothetical protein
MIEMTQASTVREEGFLRLSGVLPSSEQIPQIEDVDEQSRGVLSYLVEWVLGSEGTGEPVEVDPATCPNCGKPCDSTRSPYCSNDCREESAFIRQFRAGLETGSLFDAEKQAALGQKLWHLLGGGYPRRQVLIPERVRRKVIERDGGCAVCGAPAVSLDHTGSG